MTPRWRVLHRVATIEWGGLEPEAMISGVGVSVCGLEGALQMPGILSRMGLPRCAKCCRRLGIPTGDGAPFNALKGDLQNA